MAGQPPINAYLATQIKTASKDQLLIMLLDGAIKFAHQAKAAIEGKNIENCSENCVKVQKILTELMGSLDEELIAPELYKNLMSLYGFCHKRMVSANIERSLPHADEAIAILYRLREIWRGAIDSVMSENDGKMPSEEEILVKAGIDPATRANKARPMPENNVRESGPTADSIYNRKPRKPNQVPNEEGIKTLKVQRPAAAAKAYAQQISGKKQEPIAASSSAPVEEPKIQEKKEAPKPAAAEVKPEPKKETTGFFRPKINIQ